MEFEHAAFLSYSRHDEEWTGVLQQNLEACLEALGHEPATVFRDKTDLAPGRSWVTGLQQGLDEAPRVILVATPESMASHRVADEWQTLVANYPDWSDGRILVARAVDCPLPPFLKAVQWIDFTGHDEAKYREGLRDLLGGILGHTNRRNLPALADGLTIPQPPTRTLPPALRAEVVDWLARQLRSKLTRTAIANPVGTTVPSLDAHPSRECAASALIVDSTGGEPVKGLQRLLRTVSAALDEDRPDEVAKLSPMLEELEKLLADRGPEGVLEALWLDKVARDHKNLVPYFDGGDQDLLFRVHVELQVAPEAAERGAWMRARATTAPGAGEPDSEGPADAPRDLVAILDTERGSRPWATGRYVVLGDPGAGKSTLLRHLAGSLARQADDDPGGPTWIPIYERLPAWLGRDEALLQWLERSLCRVDADAQGFAQRCEQWAEEGRLLLLLDGLDEVQQEDREAAEALLRDLTARWPETPIVVASRPIGYQPLGGDFTELHLLPLGDDQQKELLARWLGRHGPKDDSKRANEALQVLRGDRWLKNLAGNPLYLTLMAMLFDAGTPPEHNPSRLYDQIFDLLMKGEHRHRHRPLAMPSPATTRAVLKRLAYGMTVDNRSEESLDELEERLYGDEMTGLRRRLASRPHWRSNLRNFLLDLADRTGILAPHDGDEAPWRYWHRSFREALTAERLKELMEEGGREAVLARAGEITEEQDASRWAEPYALLTGRVDEPDGLVRELVEVNRPLGLRALASARTLKTETVVDVLGLTGHRRERAKVYQELPRLVGDGRAVLELVERLRRETRDGDDLFWLDWVAREVGRGEAELAGDVEALLGRFFDHIDPPPLEVFGRKAEVETGRDGRVPLWCEIPAGEFLMGSPGDEEGRHEDEGPRHRVELQSGFRLAAVPVTRAQYALFDPGHRSDDFWGVDEEELAHHPVNNVSWWAAVSFCRWLSEAVPESAGARLPTEAEWEYACRAGRQTPYWNGEGEAALKEVGWYSGNSGGRTHRVGELRPNAWGLYDVHGNVWEWTVSRWTGDYSDRRDGETEDPGSLNAEAFIGIDRGGGGRVFRGGSYADGARGARSACRDWRLPGDVRRIRGFRVALPAAPSDLRS